MGCGGGLNEVQCLVSHNAQAPCVEGQVARPGGRSRKAGGPAQKAKGVAFGNPSLSNGVLIYFTVDNVSASFPTRKKETRRGMGESARGSLPCFPRTWALSGGRGSLSGRREVGRGSPAQRGAETLAKEGA